MRLLAKEFSKSHPKFKIDVPASIGSKAGIQAVANGAITVGLISRPLKEQEKELGLTFVPYAQTATAIAAHPTVSDKGITSAELIEIYKGTKNHWQDGQEIIVLTREEESSITVLEEKISGFREVFAESNRAKRWTTLYKDQEMNQVLAKTSDKIGLADVGTLTSGGLLSSIKVINFNGVSPTLENLASGKYLLSKQLAFVYQKEILPNVKAFLSFIQSQAGKRS
jgi:phosphate transport system substrate-binding protein